MPKVKILPDNITKEVYDGKNLLEVIRESGVYIDAICSGKGTCKKCKVRVDKDIVLACEKKIEKDIEVEIINKDNLGSYKGNVNIEIKNSDPIVTKTYLKIDKPTLKDQESDIERITRKFNHQVKIENSIIPKIHDTLIKSDYEITLTIINNTIINIQKNNTENKNYAISIDLGTTTVGGYLIDVCSQMVIDSYSYTNLQKPYGADVISRINFAIQDEQNLEKLQTLAIKSINIVINKLIENKNIYKENINIVSIVGNTTMSHLLLKTTPKGISKSPFNPVFRHMIEGKISELGIKGLSNHTRFILLPNIGGYVGSDTLGVVIGADILNKEGNHLVIDIGTNCEIALKTNKKLLAASTSAGPAFEGANMKCGLRAENGAIYSCEIDKDIYIKTIGDEKAKGICGSGYIDIVTKLIQNNIIKKQGRILEPNKLNINDNIKNRIIKEEKQLKIVLDKNDIIITQQDISNLQLAKGAIKAAIEILMLEANIDELDNIYLAGAFGSNINIDNLKTIKMIPNIENEKIIILGNGAASGAIKVILSSEIYEKIYNLSKKIEHIELSNHENFQSKFIKGIMF